MDMGRDEIRAGMWVRMRWGRYVGRDEIRQVRG